MGDEYSGGDYVPVRGMSLRDWYAGQALIGVLSNNPVGTAIGAAVACYNMADAMMAERKNRQADTMTSIAMGDGYMFVDRDLADKIEDHTMTAGAAKDEMQRRHG